MSYLVLARKYRPQTFEQVVAQSHVTQTLANAIALDRVAHAILFAGPRGTGKTTIARVLAKALNCEQGPTATPCNECRSCREITSGSGADVFEIDGASNNSVDQIRELRENVKYLPSHSPRKIYIIDEVHMLSIAAFNALLKTLEEPPAHIMFLFATTEVHKIPITILSRCQRHDLRRVDTGTLAKHLKWICDQESYSADDESLWTIAREAGGSVRDSLSLLDQVMACSEDTISQQQILDVLGVVDRKLIFDMAVAIFKGDVALILEAIDEIYGRGIDIKKFYGDLVSYFRDLLVIKMGRQVEKLVDLPGHEIAQMQQQAVDVTAAYLHQLFETLFKEEATIRLSGQPKLALEMAFIRLFEIKPILPIDTLIEKIDRLRDEIGQAPPPSTSPQHSQAPAPQPQATTSLRTPATPESRPQATPARRRESAADAARQGPPPLTSAAPASVSDGQADYTPTQPPSAPPEPEGAPEPVAAADLTPEQRWQRVCEALAATHPVLGANLTKCKFNGIEDDRLKIEILGNGFVQNTIKRPKNSAALKAASARIWGRPLELDLVVGKDPGRPPRMRAQEREEMKREALRHPLVADAMDIFKGKVIDVKVLKPKS